MMKQLFDDYRCRRPPSNAEMTITPGAEPTQWDLHVIRRALSFTLLTVGLNPVSVPATDGAVQFVDHTVAAGLALENVSGTTQSYIVEGMMGGAAFFDYDDDGDIDLYVANGSSFDGFAAGQHPTNRLYRNTDGIFEDVTTAAAAADTSWSMGCAVADYDNDGDADLYVTNFGANTLLANSGQGSFVNATRTAGVGHQGWGTGRASEISTSMVTSISTSPTTSTFHATTRVRSPASGRTSKSTAARVACCRRAMSFTATKGTAASPIKRRQWG
jgi:hypothetical protein